MYSKTGLDQVDDELQMMRFSVDRAGDSIFWVSRDGHILYANDMACSERGYSREEMLGMKIFDLDPDYQPGVWDPHFEELSRRGTILLETRHRASDGRVYPVEVSANYVQIGGREFNFCSVRDITKRKQAEEAILKTNERLALAQSTSRSGVWEWNMTTGHFDWSVELFNLFGLDSTKDEPGIEAWRSLLHPEDRVAAEESFEYAVRNGTQLDSEFRIVRRDGTVHWINTLGRTASDELRHESLMIGICIDITERKQTEETVQESNDRARMILETLSEGVSLNEMIFNDQGEMIDFRILEVNSAFYRTADFNKNAAVVGQLATQLYGMDAETIRLFWKDHRYSVENLRSEMVSPISKKTYSLSTSPFINNRFVTSFIDITEFKQAAEKIEKLAYHDSLTGLPNRQLLLDRLRQVLVVCARSGRNGALLFIDLDNFKNLNDTLGHDIGDLLLQQVTQRLEFCIRQGDTVARMGGDEFVVMLLDLSEQPIEAAAQTEVIGEKILSTLSQPYQLDKYTHRCTASIGVSLFGGNQQVADELMKQADIAMYQAKKAGRNALRFFDSKMQENISDRVTLEGELHNALEFKQFHLYYQIQVDSSLRPLGAEALIRWIHPSRGMVSPIQFIPLAEETGLILPIGLWVLEAACAQLKAWQQDALTSDLTMAVNVSAKQFLQADFVAQLQEVVKRFSINPNLLKLELTESLLQENIEKTIAIMNELNEVGVQFSLDDFGTGYSSLQYLKRLPLDQLKIDQSFVRDIAIDSSDKAVVRAIISMAQSLGIGIIAEGVETEEQRQLLLENSCTHFQGYLFGRPVPIEQFEDSLKRG
jgi:diguanylate cyclase (GGDEF)-like protein/PAS domain S-box-containing protein